MRIAIVGCILAAAVLGQAPQTKLPDGDGKQATERICSACHEVETAVSERHDKEGWQKVIDDMISKGADGSDAEFKTIVEYLSKYFGPKAPEKN